MKLASNMMSGLVKLSLAFILAVSGSVNAAPIINGSLGLTEGDPDIQSNFLGFDYEFATNSFEILSAFGGAQLTYNGITQNIVDSSFSIQGTADGTTANLELSIKSGIQTLLAGSLTSMAYSGVGTFQFIFGSLGGSLSNIFGNEVGVDFSDGSLAGFDFTGDFTSSTAFSGRSNTFAVSAPSTFSLSLLGLMLLAVARRKRV